MDTKKALEDAIKDVKKEWGWVLRESISIKKLQEAIEKNDTKHFKKFERKSARFERRINRFEQKTIGILNFLRQTFPSWNQTLFEFERQTKIYNEIILKRVSRVEGTIPELIKQNDVDKLKIEVDTVMDKGILPLDALLEDLEKRLKESYKNYLVAEETQLDKHTEDYLKKQPFLVIFHSVNSMELVKEIFEAQNLPTSFLGRRLEYAVETDFFWVERSGKLALFFGHAPSFKFLIPGKAKILLPMRHGTYKGGPVPKKILNMLYRKGLLLPEILFKRIGKIKIMIEIKKGYGSEENAFKELISQIKSYGLENKVLFLSFSKKPLAYLKQMLPTALTAKISSTCPKDHFIDIFDGQSFVPEKVILRNIKKAAENRKFFIGGGLKSQKKFYLLIEHGARGALVWKEPKEILGWLAHPELAKATLNKESIASKPF